MTPRSWRCAGLLGSIVVVSLLAVPVSGTVLGSSQTPKLSSANPPASDANEIVGPHAFVGGATLSFVETGLPNATNWSVTLLAQPRNGSGPWFSQSNTSTVSFTVATGTYEYMLWNVTTPSTLYVPSNASNQSVSVGASGATVNVSYTSLALYPLQFVESGLANGTYWEVQVNDSSIGAHDNGQSTSTTILLEVPAGVYTCFVQSSPPYGVFYSETPENASVTVPTSSTLNVTFSLETTYTVSFSETGLPSGSSWGAGLTWWNGGAGWEGPAGTVFSIPRPNGTYQYGIQAPSGWRIDGVAPSGNLTIDGASVVVSVTFVSGPTYSLTLAEKGLRTGQGWSVVIDGQNASSVTTGITLRNLTPGHYAYSVPSLRAGETVTVKVGKTVEGAAGSIDVVHSRTVTLTFAYHYEVTFTQTGLTSGTWSVSVKGQKLTAPWDQAITDSLTNGTYAYKIGSEPGYRHSSSPRKVVVPTAVSVAVVFTKTG